MYLKTPNLCRRGLNPKSCKSDSCILHPCGLYWDNGKANGNYYSIRVIMGLYWDNGKENGNYYSILGVILE